MYIKCYSEPLDKYQRNYNIHLWDDEDGYSIKPFKKSSFLECPEYEREYYGLSGENLKEVTQFKNKDEGLHFHDMPVHQRFLINKYGTNSDVSSNQKIVYFDIEIEIGGKLTEKFINDAPNPVTSIAWYYKNPFTEKEQWFILILDKEKKLEVTKREGNKIIFPCDNEETLLELFIRFMEKTQPDILVGFNSDYFDIPYLYHRMENVLGEGEGRRLSPVESNIDGRGIVQTRPLYQPYWTYRDMYVHINGVESLDYLRLHKKYSWKDEPSNTLDYIGKKYAKLGKIDYDGTLDTLFKEDIDKFIDYNFRDVEILVKLEEKLQYLELTKNLAHKGKINYSEVYANSKVHDGAISSYLIDQGIIPPRKDPNSIEKKGYAGGYLFCPKAGIFNYVFDEDLTSLYPSIIMSLNIGKETLVGRILNADDRDNRKGLNDLLEMDPNELVHYEDKDGNYDERTVSSIVSEIKDNKYTISANGVLFRTDIKSVLSTILETWFNERVYYKKELKKAYKKGDTELGATLHMKQYTMKILLNSLYGATALKGFRYGNVYLSEAITLTGQRIIQESALKVNRVLNKVMNGDLDLDIEWGEGVIENHDASPFESGSRKDEEYSDTNGTTRLLGRDSGL